MTPRANLSSSRIHSSSAASRSWPAALVACSLAVGLLVGMAGCSERVLRAQSPEDEADKKLENEIKLIGDVAVPFGMQPMEVEAVGLVTGLDGTGSDPEPGPNRAVLLSEMQTRGIKNPNQVLADPSTALVLVRAVLRPGLQKGDTFDVEVRIPSRDKTASLRGGYLLLVKLKENAVLGGEIRTGHLVATAEGPVMVDPGADSDKDAVILGRGRVLGGGRALKSRPLALVLQPGSKSVRVSAQVQASVDARFHRFVQGNKVGVATAKTDEYVELGVNPRYKSNIPRYLQVVRAVPLRESSQDRSLRIKLLEKQLLDPFTAARAAVRLEAIGHEGIPILKKGLTSEDPEVRFYSAESLAYLDQSQSVPVLAEAARDEPAFRVFALTALSALDDSASYEALRELLDSNSAETRYGAFRALWAMDEQDHFVRGELLGGQFSYHVLDSSGPPMVHATRGFRPEIVLFSQEIRLTTPLLIDAGNLLVQSEGGETIRVSRFASGKPDQMRDVSNKVDDVIRAVVEVGGNYPDVVQILQKAAQKKVLGSRFEVDALPEARSYDRKIETAEGKPGDGEKSSGFTVSNPLPNLFPKKESLGGRDESGPSTRETPIPEEETPGFGTKFKRWFGKKES